VISFATMDLYMQQITSMSMKYEKYQRINLKSMYIALKNAHTCDGKPFESSQNDYVDDGVTMNIE
jgi:hypothetical protein